MDRQPKLRTALVVTVSLLALGAGSALADTTHCVHPSGFTCSTACIDAHTTIQDAVNDAVAGDTVHVCAGEYDEQVTITIPLTLQGEGAGATIIQPSSVVTNTSSFSSGAPIAAIVLVDRTTDVAVTDLTVDGVDAAFNACSPGYVGIFYRASSGTIQDTEVLNIHHPEAPGCQTVLGIFAQGVTRGSDLQPNVTILNNVVANYGKNGITANGFGTFVTVTSNTVMGRGPVGVGDAAQNGVQLGFGARGRVAQNTLSDNFYTPPEFVACGVLFFLAGGGVDRGQDNTFIDNEQNVCNAAGGPAEQSLLYHSPFE